MLRDALLDFKNQFLWEPIIENKDGLRTYGKIIACGMGGSRLAAGFLKTIRPDLNIKIWNDYGLPTIYEKDSFVIITSYSGMTEEAIENFMAAREAGLQTAVITGGGDLLNLAKKYKCPYVQIMESSHARMASGYMLKSLVSILGDSVTRDFLISSTQNLVPGELEPAGKEIAESIKGIPVIYASRFNRYLAEYWKITLNETSKSPAFWNILPELAHNELAGITEKEGVTFILLDDADDHPRVQVKMRILENILKEKNIPVHSVTLNAGDRVLKVFNSFILATWTSLYLAKINNADPESSGAIENFKSRILGK